MVRAKAELASVTAVLSAGDELSMDEDVEAAVRARHLAAALADPANREEACDIRRRLGIQIGLSFCAQKRAPKRSVRWLKGGVMGYGDADVPAAARPSQAAHAAEDESTWHRAANPFAEALLAAMAPNAPKDGRKSLDRRQTVDSTTTAPSGKPGRDSAGGLTKATSFGRESSGGPPLPMGNRGSCDLATLAIFPEYVEFDARDVLQYVMPPPAGRKPA